MLCTTIVFLEGGNRSSDYQSVVVARRAVFLGVTTGVFDFGGADSLLDFGGSDPLLVCSEELLVGLVNFRTFYPSQVSLSLSPVCC